MPSHRHEDLPPHLRPHDQPRLYEELPLEELPPPPPEMGPRGERHDERPTPPDPFMRR
ncbi:MAG TPA: hypothetical protein VF846_10440 [Thermoanaerobaculia bacterium]|jgi:hypothetical protein